MSRVNEWVPNILAQTPVRGLFACLLLFGVLFSACGGPGNESVASTPTPQPVETPVSADASQSAPSATAESAANSLPEATSSPVTAAPPIPTETAVPEEFEPVDGHIDFDEFEATLHELVSGIEGTVAVSLVAVDGTVLWELNAEETMEAASLYKLAVMVEVYHQQAEGLLAFDDLIELSGSHFAEGEDSFALSDVGSAVDIETLMAAMITQSSNVAAYALLELVGSDNVNATMIDLGLDGIEIRWSPTEFVSDEPGEDETVPEEPEDVETEETDEPLPDPESEETEEPSGRSEPMAGWLAAGTGVTATLRGEAAFNTTQASDLAQLLVMMLNGSVVSESASQEMLDLLARQEIYGGLPALLPEGAVAHKTGYLEDGIVNDAGVIYTPAGPMVAVVLTEGVGEESAYTIASQIGLLLYQLGSD